MPKELDPLVGLMRASLADLALAARSDQAAAAFLESLLWPDGVVCPACDGPARRMQDPRSAAKHIWSCRSKACARQFSWRTESVFHGSQTHPRSAIWGALRLRDGLSPLAVRAELVSQIGISRYKADQVLLVLLQLAISEARNTQGDQSTKVRELNAHLREATHTAQKSRRRARFSSFLVACSLLLLPLFANVTPSEGTWEGVREKNATWISGGHTQFYTCPRLPGESRLEWARRFDERVKLAKTAFPPDKVE